ncbi:TetR/AcrR family transcriptional regulator [Frankia sp. QA3]|uniref:TetR/AcrR family transcriptional regulator n=1 Tax=Frankia sp. QA3 TaxID=710111 RepID=UPI000269C9C2|nr:TetR/AcrR family transcriptional regulator [Frankia sp. QA3]EIV94691.1 transcriptional regulator [Frankia sp. QA3]
MAVVRESAEGTQPTVGRRRRARGSLSSGEILAAARDLVAQDGLARLSMPALARRLGCGVMSVYRYFDTKDDLLAALADQAMSDLHRQLPPAGDGPWRDELITYFTAYRDLMESFSVYREVVLYAPTFVIRAALTPAQLRRLDTGIGLLLRAGLPLADAAEVYNVCFNYTRSFVAFEHAARATATGAAATAAAARAPAAAQTPGRQLPADEYPQLSRLADIDGVLGVDERGFRLGLELLATGIAGRYHVADR